MDVIFYLAFGGLVLFLIITNAVKIAMKEVLVEFKQEIVDELKYKKSDEDNEL